jgi:glyoxylase-like metal-dependent hydrolase (beta-lactamase superfamily II)
VDVKPLDPSVVRIEVPTPFAVGGVNVYLIEDSPLTLVDSGPAWTTALHGLKQGLASAGRRVEDLELIVITHQHADHLGLASTLVELSGAEVATLDVLAEVAGDYERWAAEDDETAAALMRRHGVAPDVVEVLRSVTVATRNWGAGVEVGRPLAPGAAIELRDRTLRVVHAPGHSPTDTLLVDEERRTVFSGDHLLPQISSNALVSSRPPGAPRLLRYPALMTYLASLDATKQLEVDHVLPGHGDPFQHHRSLIEGRLEAHEARAQRVLELVRQGPRSVHSIGHEIWGIRAVRQAWLATSEVLGHLDLLHSRGLVEEVDHESGAQFVAT